MTGPRGKDPFVPDDSADRAGDTMWDTPIASIMVISLMVVGLVTFFLILGVLT